MKGTRDHHQPKASACNGSDRMSPGCEHKNEGVKMNGDRMIRMNRLTSVEEPFRSGQQRQEGWVGKLALYKAFHAAGAIFVRIQEIKIYRCAIPQFSASPGGIFWMISRCVSGRSYLWSTWIPNCCRAKHANSPYPGCTFRLSCIVLNSFNIRLASSYRSLGFITGFKIITGMGKPRDVKTTRNRFRDQDIGTCYVDVFFGEPDKERAFPVGLGIVHWRIWKK